MLSAYLLAVVGIPVAGFIPALTHGAFSSTLRKPALFAVEILIQWLENIVDRVDPCINSALSRS